MFWKTRWGASIDGSNTPYRTLITYKETHFNAPTDPQDPPTWTGTWRDPRFSPPADGGKPENALTGQEFLVNSGTRDITVPVAVQQARLLAQHAVAKLSAGADADARPGRARSATSGTSMRTTACDRPGEFDLSSTTVSGVQPSPTTAPRPDRHRHPQPVAVPSTERRARLRRGHGPVGVGPGRRQRVGRRWATVRRDARSEYAAGDGQLVRRHGGRSRLR